MRSFDTWRDPNGVVALAKPLVMVRPPDTAASLLAGVPAEFDRYEWESMLATLPQLDVSSTMIRARCEAGLCIRGLTPVSVERYIGEHGLYRKTSPEQV